MSDLRAKVEGLPWYSEKGLVTVDAVLELIPEGAVLVTEAQLRSPRNSLGKLALPKGLMEWAVQDAWEASVSPVGDPADGIEMHRLDVLADGIVTALLACLRETP